MGSYRGARFPGPLFNQNVLRSNINVNPAGDRHPRPSFQRPPSAPYRPVQPPEGFMHGNFQNRPQFSNFPEACFRNRVPPPEQVFRFNSPPPNQMFRMNPPPSQLFRMNSPNQGFRMNSPPPNQGFRMNSHPPNQGFRMNSPPPNQTFIMKSEPSDQAFRMKSPPPVFRPRFTGHFERPFRPWSQVPSFGVPNSPFESCPRAQIQSHQHKNQPLQANRKRKQKTREFRKLKEDTTEKPFSCDTCDRAFVTENELQDHLSQHIKCDHENCMFEAHPKIVALHQKMQHDTGYADRINKLQDDAEIRKWREERKRRFPTAENIRKRKAEQAEKEARGEVLETKEFGKFKRRREGNAEVANNGTDKKMQKRGYRRHNRRRNFRNHPYSRPLTVTIDSESDSDSDSHITLSKFSGMSSLNNSVSEIHNQNEAVNVSTCEQNLSEFGSDHISHPDVSHTNNNSSNGKTDQSSFLLNDDNIQECGTLGAVSMPNEKDNFEDRPAPADEFPCITLLDELDAVKAEVVDLADRPAPTEESAYITLSDEMDAVESEVVDLAAAADESICSIPMNERDSVQPEVIDLGDSEDEGPMVAPITKTGEKAITDDSGSFQTTDFPHQKSNEFKKEAKLNLKADKSNQGLKKEHSNVNGFSNRQNHTLQARKSTILEKLLADDIRHERNVILQCIRHIVNNNFFGINNKKS